MRTTFLLGNGFDLSCGLKTRYSDFYPYYVELKNSNPSIQKFKKDINKDVEEAASTKILKHFNWSDFEEGLAIYAKKVNSEKELIDCVRDFRRELGYYLIRQQNAFSKEISGNIMQVKILDEIFNSLNDAHKRGFCQGAVAELQERSERAQVRSLDFISFNYTTVLDYLLTVARNNRNINSQYPNINHIHGSIMNNRIDDLALGIDNEEQLLHTSYHITPKGKRTFIKPEYNWAVYKNRVQAAQTTITNSDMIYVYGLSLGNSDLTWRNFIVDWLERDPSHILVYSVYEYSIAESKGWDEKLDMVDDAREELLRIFYNDSEKQLNCKIAKQIFIPVGEKIFNISDVLSKPPQNQIEKVSSAQNKPSLRLPLPV